MKSAHTIPHSGKVWRSLGFGPSGGPRWPIEELFARCGSKWGPPNFGPKVRARIKRLNVHGKEEGVQPRGWHPHRRSHEPWTDCISRGAVIRKYGRSALGKVKSVGNGKRGAYPVQLLEQRRAEAATS